MAIGLVLTLCTSLGCNNYVIDAPLSKWDCSSALVVESDKLGQAFTFNKQGVLLKVDYEAVRAYVKPYKVREPVEAITAYDFTCERVQLAYAAF